MRQFRPDSIDVLKLVDLQDINELLVLIEFILCIVLKCKNCETLLERLGELPETAALDLQELIEGANIQFSEAPSSFVDNMGDTFVQNYQQKADMANQIEYAEMKRRQFELKMIEMEEE